MDCLKHKQEEYLKDLRTKNTHIFIFFTIINEKLEIMLNLEFSMNVSKTHIHNYTGYMFAYKDEQPVSSLLFQIIFHTIKQLLTFMEVNTGLY